MARRERNQENLEDNALVQAAIEASNLIMEQIPPANQPESTEGGQSSRTDEFWDRMQSDLDTVELEVLNARLKSLASKKSRSKAMGREDDYLKAVELENLLKSVKEDRFPSVKGVVSELDLLPETVEEIIDRYKLGDIQRLIKNAQSRKCLSAAMHREDEKIRAEQREALLKEARNILMPEGGRMRMRSKATIMEKIQQLRDEVDKNPEDSIPLVWLEALEWVVALDEVREDEQKPQEEAEV